MDFEWDEVKSERNRVERGLSFDLAIELFGTPTLERLDDPHDYGEVRVQAIGRVAGKILLCVHTNRGPVHRIISLRYANRRERDGFDAAEPR